MQRCKQPEERLETCIREANGNEKRVTVYITHHWIRDADRDIPDVHLTKDRTWRVGKSTRITRACAAHAIMRSAARQNLNSLPRIGNARAIVRYQGVFSAGEREHL